MKKKLLLLFLVSTFTFCLSSCGEIVSYKDHLDDYVLELDYHDGFNILQLTDLHWSALTDHERNINYLNALIEQVKKDKGNIDLIELTGDQTMLGSKEDLIDLLKTINSYNIPFAVVWGNHDRESRYSPRYVIDQYLSNSNCLYKEVENDDVHGSSNYVINLKKDGVTKWQIANLDSGADYCESVFSFDFTFDYIRESQVAWFEEEHNLIGNNVPVIAYYHIAQKEFENAWSEYNNYQLSADVSKQKYYKLEKFDSSNAKGSEEPVFFNKAHDFNIKGIFVGHCHNNDWTCNYKGVTIGCGVKTGKELYYAHINEEQAKTYGISEKFDLIGASLVTLHDDETFDLSHLYFNEESSDTYKAIWLEY